MKIENESKIIAVVLIVVVAVVAVVIVKCIFIKLQASFIADNYCNLFFHIYKFDELFSNLLTKCRNLQMGVKLWQQTIDRLALGAFLI